MYMHGYTLVYIYSSVYFVLSPCVGVASTTERLHQFYKFQVAMHWSEALTRLERAWVRMAIRLATGYIPRVRHWRRNGHLRDMEDE